jgi:hypothetical protein
VMRAVMIRTITTAKRRERKKVKRVNEQRWCWQQHWVHLLYQLRQQLEQWQQQQQGQQVLPLNQVAA